MCDRLYLLDSITQSLGHIPFELQYGHIDGGVWVKVDVIDLFTSNLERTMSRGVGCRLIGRENCLHRHIGTTN